MPDKEFDDNLEKLEEFCQIVDDELENEKYAESDWNEQMDMLASEMETHNITISDLGTIVEQEWYYECSDLISEYYYKDQKHQSNSNNREKELNDLLEGFVKRNIEHIYDKSIEKDGEIIFEGNKVIYSIIIEKGN